MQSRFALTIYHKLVALIVILMVGVVGGLALYLSSQQIETMAASLRTKAATYGSVMARQTTSAVAFSDRETAREVLQSIDADGDVSSVELYNATGALLYSRGTTTTPIASAAAVVAPRVVDTGARIAAVHPVVSLEGPRGVLVIELSTASLDIARHHVRRLALLTGLVAIALGAIAAWLIARQLVRRLRAIANVASEVAAGDLAQEPIADGRRDEIGTLAAAFNAMLAQLQQLIAHIQDLARKEQDRLENLVAQRTAQLDQRTAEMQLVFDQVDQGLLMVDLEGTIARERSAAVERLLGPAPASGKLHDYVATFSPDAAAWFQLQWDALREGVLPAELCLAQLPARFEAGHRHLELAYKLIDGDGAQRVLVVISDATAEVQRQRAERDERETASLLTRMLRGRAGFLAFHAEAGQYVAEIAGGGHDAVFKRTVHTLKGIAALEGIGSIAELCHTLEAALADGDELAVRSHARAISNRWQLVTGKLSPLLAATSTRVELLPGDLAQLEAALRAGAPARDLLAIVDGWRHERVEARLQRFADDAHVLASQLGKGPIDVALEVDDGLRLPGKHWGRFWTAFVHAIRNAIDHGLEAPHERRVAGKKERARLTLRAHRQGDGLAIEIDDNGRGIDWAKVADKARAHDLPATTRDDLVDALFHDGFTTRDTATEVSGRGVGLSALRHECVSSGGYVRITSRDGAGTTLGFRWSNLLTRPEPLQIAG
jgi:HAMP domain-containing protein/HPt (histidine-containing phosphotransfer) domain-containing protein